LFGLFIKDLHCTVAGPLGRNVGRREPEAIDVIEEIVLRPDVFIEIDRIESQLGAGIRLSRHLRATSGHDGGGTKNNECLFHFY